MKEKPIFPLLMSMALPMVISMLVNSLYNIVDSLFIARISEDAMTAISLVYPMQNFVNAFAIGYGVGLNALISFYLGAQEMEHADDTATQGLVFAVIHGLVIMIVTIAVIPAFLRLFTSDTQVLAMGIQYARIVFSFSLITMFSLTFEKFFQAVARMKVAMVSLMCGCVSNIILDPLMIFGIGFFPRMGIAGAALATGIGQVISVVVYLVAYFCLKPTPVRFRLRYVRLNGSIDRRLYAIGIPAMFNLALPSLLVSVLNAILTIYSASYVVVLGIYYKLQTFLYLPANGVIQGMRPLIGYNYGAGEHRRVQRIYGITLATTAVIMLAGTVICLAAAGPLIGLFTTNPETIRIGRIALRIICAGFVVSAVSVTSSGALEGLGKGVQSLVISLFRYVIFILPLAWLLSHFAGPDRVWNAFWITEVLTAVISLVVYNKATRTPPSEKA